MNETKQKQKRKWVNAQEVAEYLGVKRNTVYDWVRERKGIPSHKPSGSNLLRFDLEEIDEWLRTCRIETANEYMKRIKGDSGNGNTTSTEKGRELVR